MGQFDKIAKNPICIKRIFIKNATSVKLLRSLLIYISPLNNYPVNLFMPVAPDKYCLTISVISLQQKQFSENI